MSTPRHRRSGGQPRTKSSPFKRILTKGGSPSPGSWGALEDSLDEMFPGPSKEDPK